LQGIAGRYYAQRTGEPDEVALAIAVAYRDRVAAHDLALWANVEVMSI
jgi:glycyl-tRNA synthetase beta chain